jgi:hypothetical protein
MNKKNAIRAHDAIKIRYFSDRLLGVKPPCTTPFGKVTNFSLDHAVCPALIVVYAYNEGVVA